MDCCALLSEVLHSTPFGQCSVAAQVFSSTMSFLLSFLFFPVRPCRVVLSTSHDFCEWSPLKRVHATSVHDPATSPAFVGLPKKWPSRARLCSETLSASALSEPHREDLEHPRIKANLHPAKCTRHPELFNGRTFKCPRVVVCLRFVTVNAPDT